MSNTCFSKKKRCYHVLCPDLCTSFFHVSLGRYRSTLTAYDEQQRKSELTFITSAFPSKFFACKQAKCFHEFVVEVLPVNLTVTAVHNTILLHNTVICRLSLVSLCFYSDSGRAFNDVSYLVCYHG